MANEEHLKRIMEAAQKQDISLWNKWRQEQKDVRPDLCGADLKRVILKGAYLQGAILRECNLRGADLSQADLTGADLHGANLVLAHFIGARAAGADFSGANLLDANLSDADLREADFSGACLGGALFQGADLTLAKLEKDVKELSPFQIKTARNWQSAYLGEKILEGLGLPLDHNAKLQHIGP